MLFRNGAVILENSVIERGFVRVTADRIAAVGDESELRDAAEPVIDLRGGYLAPGYVDLHVHGGAGADFMDGTAEAFRTVCRAHARHGTTSLLPTTTVARHEQHLAFLNVCRRLKREGSGGARILGAHFYGPYFAAEARGCHPAGPVRPPEPGEYEQYLAYVDSIATATVAPELPG